MGRVEYFIHVEVLNFDVITSNVQECSKKEEGNNLSSVFLDLAIDGVLNMS